MRKNFSRGKDMETGNWVEGFYVRLYDKRGRVSHRIYPGYAETDCGDYYPDWYEVDPETVGHFTGVVDTELLPVCGGDIVRFLDYVGTVVFQSGCFGIALDIRNSFDWDLIDEEMEQYAGTNQLTACFNDHFISLWEILWNFNCDENICNVIEVIGNIHDNPELLETA